MESSAPLVVKTGESGDDFTVEAFMLRYLAKNTGLPISKIHHADKVLLIMDWLDSGDTIDGPADTRRKSFIDKDNAPVR